jgi:5-methylcytosine-specific restriction endonuclease McrA
MVKGRHDPRVTRDWKRIRLAVLARDGYTCAYCGQDASTVDHVRSIKAGGDPMDMDNCVAACRRCNSSKGSRSQAVFLAANSTRQFLPKNDQYSPCRAVCRPTGSELIII